MDVGKDHPGSRRRTCKGPEAGCAGAFSGTQNGTLRASKLKRWHPRTEVVCRVGALSESVGRLIFFCSADAPPVHTVHGLRRWQRVPALVGLLRPLWLLQGEGQAGPRAWSSWFSGMRFSRRFPSGRCHPTSDRQVFLLAMLALNQLTKTR